MAIKLINGVDLEGEDFGKPSIKRIFDFTLTALTFKP
jgi:hypothetical protein